MLLYGCIGEFTMPFESIFDNLPDTARKASANCALCQKRIAGGTCPNIPYIQEHLLSAANILSQVVEASPTKELCFASETLSRDDVAIAALNLICLVQKLEVLKVEHKPNENELFD